MTLTSSCDDAESEPDVVYDVEASAELFQILADTDSTFIQTSEARGSVTVHQLDSVVTMTIDLVGFTPNTIHAVHMHHGTCEQPKHHWNSGSTEKFCNEKSLGIPWAKPFAGDFGNVSVGYDGSGSLTIKTDLWRLASGDSRDIMGLQVIIHDKHDDFTGECDPSHSHNHGHPNTKIACGTIL
ncbi:MAG: superoxide dismutase family protein [Cyclobacteriaceae bacterium]